MQLGPCHNQHLDPFTKKTWNSVASRNWRHGLCCLEIRDSIEHTVSMEVSVEDNRAIKSDDDDK